ncbi:MAG TPA: alanine racemase [Chthoniobacteraceae bacterium]|nr:alanine racemase [Chthoniobacteraceae bacterium]
MEPMFERCWAEIDLDALRHNVAAIRAALAPGTGLTAVLKANAYGHGLAPVAEALHDRVEAFAVASVAEALTLRGAVPEAPVMILGPVLPEEREWVVAHGFYPMISSQEEAAAFAALVPEGEEPLDVHLAVDTGMGRIGVWKTGAVAVAEAIAAMPQLRLAGVSTHLPVADDDPERTQEQLARWRHLIAEMEAAGVKPPMVHALNSAGVIRYGLGEGEESNGNLVRTGLMLYGIAPVPEFQPQLEPVLTWKTRVSLVRKIPQGRSISYGRTFIAPSPMKVATLAAGYGDGYFRHLSNVGAAVLIGGKRCPVLGRVTMDQTVVDVSHLPEVAVGDEVVLIGRQGEERLLATEVAAWAGTIAWELFTAITGRVRRVYLNG